MLRWTVDDVVQWLQSLGKGYLASAFRRMNVTGAVLPRINDTMLCELGVSRSIERAVLLASIKRLIDQDH